MALITLNKWRGIAPALHGENIFAQRAKNVNLRGRTLQGASPDFFTGETGHSGEIVLHEGSWVSGDSNYIEWILNDFPVLFFKQAGVWKRQIGGIARDLGLTRPADPVLAQTTLTKPNISEYTFSITESTSNFLLPAQYSYYITTIRTVAGEVFESDISEGFTMSPYGDGSPSRFHTISRPSTLPDPNATGWRVYRSDSGDTPRLIQEGSATGIGQNLDFIVDQLGTNDRGLTTVPRTLGKYQFKYAITWTRDTGGYLDESGPSNLITINVPAPGVTITRPTSPPSGVTKWNIYRISQNFDATSDFELVESVSIASTNYEDLKPNSELGGVLPTRFTGLDGSPIILLAPDVTFDGIAGPYAGMLIAWKGVKLYLSEPGLPDSYSSEYIYHADAPIISVEVSAGELMVITTGGIQRGIGTRPSEFQIVPGDVGEGAVDRKMSVSCELGVFYLARNGISQVAGSSVALLSDQLLGKDFFSDNISTTTIGHMEYHDRQIFLFHDNGVLVYDAHLDNWYELTATYEASFFDKDSGRIYGRQSGNIVEIGADTGTLAYEYETSELILTRPRDKRFKRFYFFGEGDVTATLILGGVDSNVKALTLPTPRDKTYINAPFDSKKRKSNVRLVGTAEVTEIEVDVFTVLRT